MNSLNDDGVLGFVVWRTVENLNLGSAISLEAGDEFGEFFLVVFALRNGGAECIEIAIEIVIIEIGIELSC